MMYSAKNIFIDFPVKGYINGTNIREVIIRKPLSKPMRFLRKLPLFSKFISNTKEVDKWTDYCKNVKNIILFDTYSHYAEYCKKIENVASTESRLILYLLNPVFFSDDYKLLSSRWEIWTFMETPDNNVIARRKAIYINSMDIEN